jgi:hypothetical protein
MSIYKLGKVRFSMDDIIDILEGWSDDAPPQWSVVVYSKTKGKQCFDRSLKNRLVMHQWQAADIEIKMRQTEKASLTSKLE